MQSIHSLNINKSLMVLAGTSLCIGGLTLISTVQSAQSAPQHQNYVFSEVCVPLTARSLQPGVLLYDATCEQHVATIRSHLDGDYQVRLRRQAEPDTLGELVNVAELPQANAGGQFFIKRVQ
ncbi:MAG: hypothetical protein AAGF24_09560 [Cyanobacteria bacterium P01_H01_bin.121]